MNGLKYFLASFDCLECFGELTMFNRFKAVLIVLVGALVWFEASADQLVGSTNKAMVLQSNGDVIGWGSNNRSSNYLSLPDNMVSISTPELLTEISNEDNLQLSSVGNISLLLRRDGSVWTWGDAKRIFIEGGTSTPAPEQVTGLPSNIIAVSAGHGHGLALTSGGKVWSFGTSFGGTAPIEVYGISDIIAIQAGSTTAYAIKSDGSLWAWGETSSGRLGVADEGFVEIPFQLIPSGVKEVSTYVSSSMALMQDGTVMSWGNVHNSNLGSDPDLSRRYQTVQEIPDLLNVVSVSMGKDHAFALLNNGTLMAWGENNSGQLGTGNTNDHYTPIATTRLTDVVQIAATATGSSYGNSYAVTSDGTVWAWGNGVYGANSLGNGQTTNALSPIRVSGIGGSGSLRINVTESTTTEITTTAETTTVTETTTEYTGTTTTEESSTETASCEVDTSSNPFESQTTTAEPLLQTATLANLLAALKEDGEPASIYGFIYLPAIDLSTGLGTVTYAATLEALPHATQGSYSLNEVEVVLSPATSTQHATYANGVLSIPSLSTTTISGVSTKSLTMNIRSIGEDVFFDVATGGGGK